MNRETDLCRQAIQVVQAGVEVLVVIAVAEAQSVAGVQAEVCLVVGGGKETQKWGRRSSCY